MSQPIPGSPGREERRRGAIRARWTDLAALAVISGLTVPVLLVWLRPRILEAAALPAPVLITGGLAIAVLLVGVFRPSLKRAPARVRNFVVYPSPAVSVVVGLAIGIASLAAAAPIRAAAGFEDASVRTLWEGAGVLTSVPFLCVLASLTLRRRDRGRSAAVEPLPVPVPSASPFGGSFDELRAWLQTDAPVCEGGTDAFGRQRIAVRLASRLAAEEPPAQAIVGRLGSGKTTIRQLTAACLAATAPHVRIVEAELWPYETTRAAVEGIITKLVDALSEEVDVLALRGLPSAYAQAMASAGGWWSAAARLGGASSDPFATLARIETIAEALGVRYVVWVEDLERFAAHGTVPGEAESPSDAERLNPIRALLLGLDRLHSVTVVTATVSLKTRFDIENIARYVEDVSDLDEDDVAQVITVFRDGCRAMPGFIDPASDKAREELDRLRQLEGRKQLKAMLGTTIRGLGDSVVALCRTPRTLKQALRATLDTWTRLLGEIDFDDILAMNILREATPDVFALLREHVDALRTRTSFERDERKEALERWKGALDALPMAYRTRAAVSVLMDEVFSEDEFGKPQGLARKGHADYWRRFLAVPELRADERDQPVLKAVREGDQASLFECLEDSSRAPTLEAFGHLLPVNDLVALLVPYVSRHLSDEDRRADDGNPSGFLPLWRMWLRRAEQGQLPVPDATRELRRALEMCVPRSLRLAVQIDYYFLAPGGRRSDLIPPEAADQLRVELRRLVVERLTARPAEIRHAFAGADAFTLGRLVWGTDVVKETQSPCDNWSSLADALLAAMPADASAVATKLAALVVRISSHRSGRGVIERFAFDPDRATRLFGDPARLLAAFAPLDRRGWLQDPSVRAVFAELDSPQQRAQETPTSTLAPDEGAVVPSQAVATISTVDPTTAGDVT